MYHVLRLMLYDVRCAISPSRLFMRLAYLAKSSADGFAHSPNSSITLNRCSVVLLLGSVRYGRIITPVNLTPLLARCRLTFRGCSVNPSRVRRYSLAHWSVTCSAFLSVCIATKSST